MRKIFVVIGLLMMISTVSASDSDWWNTSYQYRMPIVLTGNTSGSQAYYQLMLNVSYNAHMQSDFNDIRFTDSSKNLLSAWLENKSDGSWATIWVNFTDTPDNGATKTYYMYYGNSEVSNYWNGTNTFIFFDDAESGIYSDKWNDQVGAGSYSTDEAYKGTHSIKFSATDDQTSVSKNIDIADAVFEAMVKIVGTSDNYVMITARASQTEKTYYGFRPNDGGNAELYKRIAGSFTSLDSDASSDNISDWYKWSIICSGTSIKTYFNDALRNDATNSDISSGGIGTHGQANTNQYLDDIRIRKYVTNPPTLKFGSEQEYTLSSESETPTPIPTPTPTPIPTIEASNYVIQNQTLYITKASTLQYRITTNQFAYGGSRNINTIICDNNLTDISGWIKIDTDQSYDADYTFFVNVNDTSYQSRIVTLKQELVDSSIISKTYKRSCWIDGYELYEYKTTVYIISVIPNPIYFYWNLEDRIIQFGDKKFNNQTLAFTQLNFDDQYEFMNTSSRDEVTMKFKTVSPETASGAELKGLTGLLLNVLSKIPYVGKSLKNVLYYPLFFIQTLFDFVFTFLDIIVNDWWYALMTLEIVCIFSASRKKGYSNIIEDYIKTHVKIIKFIYEVIILNMINLIITIIVTIKDMIKWW